MVPTTKHLSALDDFVSLLNDQCIWATFWRARKTLYYFIFTVVCPSKVTDTYQVSPSRPSREDHRSYHWRSRSDYYIGPSRRKAELPWSYDCSFVGNQERDRMEKIQAILAIGKGCNKLLSKDGLDKMFFISLPRYPLKTAVYPLSNPDRQPQIPMIKVLLEYGANPLQTINIYDEPSA